MNKRIGLPLDNISSPLHGINQIAQDLIKIIAQSDIDYESVLGANLVLLLSKLKRVETLLETEYRMSLSSDTSSASLGDRIAAHDKDQFLYTYQWVSRNGDFNGWAKGNDFKTWVNSPYQRLPAKNSKLNCWEATIVLLYLYHAVTKSEIKAIYDVFADSTGDVYSAEKILGLEDRAFYRTLPVKKIADFVKSGDVIVFHSNRGAEFGHVALVLDNFEKLWVSSHWCLPPKGHMISLTPNRIFKISKDAALERFEESVQALQLELTQLELEVSKVAHQEIMDSSLIIRSYADVHSLYFDALKNCQGMLSDLSDDGIYNTERIVMMPILRQVLTLLNEMSTIAQKFEDDPDKLGVLYNVMDKLDQINWLRPCYELEYLASDYVVISTKFRKYFEE